MRSRMLGCLVTSALAAGASLLGTLGVPWASAAGLPGGGADKAAALEQALEPAAASVNICGAGDGTLGVRVRAPYRGEDLTSTVRVQVEWYSSHDGAWHPVPSADSGWFAPGPAGTEAWTGYTFPFAAPSRGHQLVMRGVASIEWRRDGTPVEHAQAVTPPCQVASS